MTQTKEKMLYFKRELENRETNFNTRFSNDATITNSPLRVIQNERKQNGSAATRRKARGKGSSGNKKGSGTRKKATNSPKLPKIAK